MPIAPIENDWNGKGLGHTWVSCDTCMGSTDKMIAKVRAGQELDRSWEIYWGQPALPDEEALKLAETHLAQRGQDHKVIIITK